MTQKGGQALLGIVVSMALAACAVPDNGEKNASGAPSRVAEPASKRSEEKELFNPFDSTYSFYMGPSQNNSNFVYLSGAITGNTVEEARKVLSSLPDSGTTYAALSSPGGDVQAAIEIGRMLREKRIHVVVVNQCASACVLVYAGGVARIASGPVIIHRPYFSGRDGAVTYAETQKDYETLRNLVRGYLQEMNVSPGLWEAMVSIAPSDGHALTKIEQNSFGLLERDPVEDEMRRQSFASKLGISADEFVRREGLARQWCSLGGQSLEEMTAWGKCYNAVMQGETIQ